MVKAYSGNLKHHCFYYINLELEEKNPFFPLKNKTKTKTKTNQTKTKQNAVVQNGARVFMEQRLPTPKINKLTLLLCVVILRIMLTRSSFLTELSLLMFFRLALYPGDSCRSGFQ
jgi:hypothetical protein